MSKLILPTVEVAFSRSHLPFSYGIRAITSPPGEWMAEWSHCAPILPSGRIIEASALRGGVLQDTLANFKHRATSWAIAEYECADPDAFYEFLLAQEGKRYDYTALIGFLAHNRDYQLDSDWFCSELGETGFIKGGSPHFAGVLKGFVSPEELWCERLRIVTESAA